MRILIVDDHEMVRTVVAEIVGMLGADVETASNGRDALEIFRTGRLDLLITDLNMPIMDGASLIRQVRQEASHLPILLITGDPQNVPNDIFLLERVLLLRKPVSNGDLVAAVLQDWRGPLP